MGDMQNTYSKEFLTHSPSFIDFNFLPQKAIIWLDPTFCDENFKKSGYKVENVVVIVWIKLL